MPAYTAAPCSAIRFSSRRVASGLQVQYVYLHSSPSAFCQQNVILQIVAHPFFLQLITSAEREDKPVEHHQVLLHKSKLARRASGHRSGLQMHPMCSELADHALIDTLTPILDPQGKLIVAVCVATGNMWGCKVYTICGGVQYIQSYTVVPGYVGFA